VADAVAGLPAALLPNLAWAAGELPAAAAAQDAAGGGGEGGSEGDARGRLVKGLLRAVRRRCGDMTVEQARRRPGFARARIYTNTHARTHARTRARTYAYKQTARAKPYGRHPD
jgi:hypothetical protein